MNSNEAFLLRSANQAKIEPWPMPPNPGPDEVLCKTLAVGICGSDLHYWKEGRCGPFVVVEPMVLGHETAAEIVAVGSNVKELKAKDRVACEPTVACGECEWCLNDKYNLCPKVTCFATPPVHGTLQRYFLHPAKACFRVPDNVSNNECAIVEPLAVAVHACRSVNVTSNSSVFITGAGPIGLLNLLVAKAFGAKRIVITDINQSRLDLARELGADKIMLVKKNTSEQKMIKQVKQAFNNNFPDITIECSGVACNSRLVFLTTKPGGRCMLVGIGPEEINLPIATAASREIQIFGCFRYKGCFPTCIELISSGKIQNLEKLVTHHFDFLDSTKAFETAYTGKGIKVMINFK